jgi:16S rRNA (adenine1518-N6/adenine1519-N6)-dimethyltransferase
VIHVHVRATNDWLRHYNASQRGGESLGGFQTKKQLKELLDNSARFPRKRYGQHFLIDRNLMQKLVEAAELGPHDCVLEVGTGTGSLTSLLAERAGRVVTAEIDEEIAAIAREQLAECPNVEMILGDALETKSKVSAALVETLTGNKGQGTGDSKPEALTLKLVANLPYDIATVLVINLLMSDLPFTRMCFTVQAEVGDRFLAVENTADFGPVSILTSIMSQPQKVCRVPPQAFWPEPKVDSAMLRLDVRPRDQWPVGDIHAFAGLVRHFFQKRRKTIGHIAKDSPWPGALAVMAELGIDPKLRPENVSVQRWAEMFNIAAKR